MNSKEAVKCFIELPSFFLWVIFVKLLSAWVQMSTHFEQNNFWGGGEGVFLLLIFICVFLFLKTTNKLGKDYDYKLSLKNPGVLTWSLMSWALFFVLTLGSKSPIRQQIPGMRFFITWEKPVYFALPKK